MPAFDGGDRALIAELALLGPLAFLDDVTWQNRDHGERYVRAVRPHPATSQTWWDADAREPVAHHWRLFRHYLRSVRQHAETRQHARCMAALARWWATDWNAARVALDAVGTQMPGAFEVAHTLRDGNGRRGPRCRRREARARGGSRGRRSTTVGPAVGEDALPRSTRCRRACCRRRPEFPTKPPVSDRVLMRYGTRAARGAARGAVLGHERGGVIIRA